jgi:hypothetical protein
VVVAVTASVFDHQRRDFLDMGFGGFLDKPLRIEQIYKYLSEHLGISYVFDDAEEDSGEQEADWSDVVLPQDLHGDLTAAVKGHSVTQIREHLARLEGLGEREQRLAQHLSALAGNYDMKEIGAVLQEIACG